MKTVSGAIHQTSIFVAPWLIVVEMTIGILLSTPAASIREDQANAFSTEQQARLKKA